MVKILNSCLLLDPRKCSLLYVAFMFLYFGGEGSISTFNERILWIWVEDFLQPLVMKKFEHG